MAETNKRSTKLSETLAGYDSFMDDYNIKTGGGTPTIRTGKRGPQEAINSMLTSDEVQDVITRNATNAMGNNAAQAAALQLDPNGLNVSGMGQAGRGSWQTLIGPGGRVDPNNAALFMAMSPGPYNSVYAPAMENLMNQLLNPQAFNYDVNADGLYQQIKDQYTKAGRQAMMDNQGQAAALTGGYGNSYGAQAGQQAYQESLGGLAGMIPELAQLAYQQYLNGEDAKRNNLEALNKLNEQDYSKWMDDMAAYLEAIKGVQAAAGSGGGGSGMERGVFGGMLEDYGRNLWNFPSVAGTSAGFKIDPAMQEAISSYVKNTGIGSDVIAYNLNQGIPMGGAPNDQWAYWYQTHSGEPLTYTSNTIGQWNPPTAAPTGTGTAASTQAPQGLREQNTAGMDAYRKTMPANQLGPKR